MNPARAVALIENRIYKPGWRLRAAESDRFACTIMVEIRYAAPSYDEEEAPDYAGPVLEGLGTNIPVYVGDVHDEDSFDDLIFERVILAAERHEAREAYRRREHGRWIAPFHPHNHDSMARYGDPVGDYLYSSLVSLHAGDFAPKAA